MKEIRAAQRLARNPQGIPVGEISITPVNPKNGFNRMRLTWVVNSSRRDKRIGPVNPFKQPVSSWYRELENGIFKKWGQKCK